MDKNNSSLTPALKLLSQKGGGLILTHVELSTAKSIDWKPWTPTKIGDARPISVNEAMANWFEQEDHWHMSDESAWMTLEEAVTKDWCSAFSPEH
jgi:hypothetical protein